MSTWKAVVKVSRTWVGFAGCKSIIAYCACRARITIAHRRRPRFKYLAVMFPRVHVTLNSEMSFLPNTMRSSLKSKDLMTLALGRALVKTVAPKIRARARWPINIIFFSLLYCRCDSTTLPSDFPHPSSRRSSGCGILPLPEGWWLKALRAADGLLGLS